MFRSPVLYSLGTNIDKSFDETFKDLFDSAFKEVDTNKYPATDVYTKNGKTFIEIAVSGFDEENLSITLEDNILTIKGVKTEEDKEREYQTKHIARRSFTRKFTISNVNDIKATIKNGILIIALIEKPKEENVKEIKIEV